MSKLGVIEQIVTQGHADARHHGGTLPSNVLRRIEQVLPARMEQTAETGCGKSTILFSNLSLEHLVFCVDDRALGDQSSVRCFMENELTRIDSVHCIFGPTQRTLPHFDFKKPFDCVLLDGGHGYPFPDLEFYYFYPQIRTGGFLIVDDVQIASVGRMADFIQEDVMFDLVELVGNTALFRRTEAETFDPLGDGWWKQRFNQRRAARNSKFCIDDGVFEMSFAERLVAERLKALRSKVC